MVAVVVVAVLEAARMGRGRTVAEAEAEGSGGDEHVAGVGLVTLGVGVEVEVIVPPATVGLESRLPPASDSAARPEVMPEFRVAFASCTAVPNMLSRFDCCCGVMVRVLSSVT